MRTIQVKLYDIHELEGESRKKALDETLRVLGVNIDDEIECIKSMANALGLKLGYSFDYGLRSWVTLEMDEEPYVEEGARSLKYIYNNFIRPNQKGKYYSYKSKHRRSKAIFEDMTTFTGLYLDLEVSFLYRDCVQQYRFGKPVDVTYFLRELERRLCSCIVKEMEYQCSDEYLSEMATENHFEFLSNGKLW